MLFKVKLSKVAINGLLEYFIYDSHNYIGEGCTSSEQVILSSNSQEPNCLGKKHCMHK